MARVPVLKIRFRKARRGLSYFRPSPYLHGPEIESDPQDMLGVWIAANLPSHSTVSVGATSQEDTTKTAAAVTVLGTAGGIAVTVTPQNPNVVFDGSKSIQFSAAVSGTSNSGVTWSVDPNYAAIGQISPTGLFTPYGFNCTNAPASGVIRAVLRNEYSGFSFVLRRTTSYEGGTHGASAEFGTDSLVLYLLTTDRAGTARAGA
jgi:hypothetical protein